MDSINKQEKFPLKVLRTIADLTQEEAANAAGVNRAAYRRWENYDTYPNAIQLIKLSEAFGCSLDAFYFPVTTS